MVEAMDTDVNKAIPEVDLKGLNISSLEDEEEEKIQQKENIIYEDDDEDEPPVTLGFVEEPEHSWSFDCQVFPSKAGGVPAWLDPVNLPSGNSTLCDICEEPLQFVLQVLSSRNVELLLGYFVRCIRKASESKNTASTTENEAMQNTSTNQNSEKYILELQLAERGSQSQIIEADLVVAQTIRSCLDELPGYPRTQIGFITYDSTIHFYNMKSSLTQPQMMVVSDLDDMFLPLPDDLLVNLSESRSVVETFLDSLPSMFQDNVNLEFVFGPALKAAFMVMSQLGGKLLIFQNTMPSLSVGRLKLRGDDLRVYGTNKEHALRIAKDPFYKQMAADFTKFQIAVDVFAFSDKYIDIASLGTLAKYTGGQVYYYSGFQSAIHGQKLKNELFRDLTRETAWEAVMRVRYGKGKR